MPGRSNTRLTPFHQRLVLNLQIMIQRSPSMGLGYGDSVHVGSSPVLPTGAGLLPGEITVKVEARCCVSGSWWASISARSFGAEGIRSGHDRNVEPDQPPDDLLHDAALKVLPGVIRPREGHAWLVDWQGTCGVLRQGPAPRDTSARARLTEDVTWLHAFLARLAQLGFPSPRPLPAFHGKSWTTSGGMLWEVVSFLPGRVVGWAAVPPMEEIGALLARYHATARDVDVTGQRPGALPLAEVPEILLSRQLRAVGVHPERQVPIRLLAERLARVLDDTGHRDRAHLVIHGDFTSHNVIADGLPPRATGVIDFALAHAETPLADIGYGLWRSGRPRQDADHLDLPRVRRFFRGYISTVPITADEASVIPVYLCGRGLQMIAKRIRAGRAETGMLAQVQWLAANGDALVVALP
jgi:Ser/Thr protein kinase RdoA (MazF antagonist)